MQSRHRLGGVVLALLLAACNGGGDGGTPAAGPATAGNPPAAGAATQNNGINGTFSGKLFYEYAGKYVTFDLAKGQPHTYLQETTDRMSFAIAPDGKMAVVAEQVISGNGENNGTHRYHVVSTEGGQTQGSFPGSPGILMGMAMNLSPDGEYIATGLFRYEWGTDHLVIEDSKGNLVFDFTAAGFDESFGWLPDGRMVVADANGWLTLFDRNFNQIKRIRQFTGSLPGRMQASPDGSRLAFSWNGHIHVMNLDGSDLRQVTTSNDRQTSHAWSPDGKWLVLAEGGVNSPVTASGSAPCPVLRIVSADASMVDVGYLTDDPRVHKVMESSGNGAADIVCGRSLSWR